MAFGKTLGCTLIISGTAVGAGMLALPMVSHTVNFGVTVLLLCLMWALMIYCALLILEITLSFKPYENNFSTMTREILGKPGQWVMWLASMLLLYSLTAAYISGASSLLMRMLESALGLHLSAPATALLFTAVFGGLVSLGVKQVDVVNRGLMLTKVLVLVLSMILLMPHIQFSELMMKSSYTSRAIFSMIPIFLTSFAFHHVIPSLANYLGSAPQSLVHAIRWGATIPLVLYIFWLATVLGVVPRESLVSIDQGAETNIGDLIHLIIQFSESPWTALGIDIFSDIALMTSFLGVTLGLFDFMADACKRNYTPKGRLQTALITFIPPLLFALLYPSGFILALGYAAIFVAIMQIILPALMVIKKRSRTDLPSPYQAPGGLVTLGLTIIVGCFLIVLQCGLI